VQRCSLACDQKLWIVVSKFAFNLLGITDTPSQGTGSGTPALGFITSSSQQQQTQFADLSDVLMRVGWPQAIQMVMTLDDAMR
jgi:hypothetical protein